LLDALFNRRETFLFSPVVSHSAGIGSLPKAVGNIRHGFGLQRVSEHLVRWWRGCTMLTRICQTLFFYSYQSLLIRAERFRKGFGWWGESEYVHWEAITLCFK